MSWISDLFGGGDDNSAVLEQQRQAREYEAAQNARAQQESDAANQSSANRVKRQQALEASKNSAYSYLQSLGLNPADFDADINAKLNEATAYTADDDPNIGQYISDLGKQVYDTRETGTREHATRDVNLAFAPDYETSRIGDTLDDPILGAVQNEQRGKADEYIQNLVKRGVITASGQAAANKNLDDQSARVRTVLNELGRSSLEGGRGRLTDIANRARGAASTQTLGNTFDPSKYTSEADTAYNEFVAGLGDSIRSKVPTDLYDTSKLAGIAGGAQGAGNLKFDPNALAGIIKPDSEQDQEQDPNKNKRVVF